MTNALSSLSQLIRERMGRLGIVTQADLARKAGLSTQDINRFFLGGTKLPGADKRRKLADALGVSHLDLLIAAGEITNDEVRAIGLEGIPIIEPERAELLDKMERVRMHDQTRVSTLRTVLDLWLLQDRDADNPVKDLVVDDGDGGPVPLDRNLAPNPPQHPVVVNEHR